MDPLPPQPGDQTSSTTVTASASPSAQHSTGKLLRSLPRIFSTLLAVAAVVSILSTLAFLGYLFLPGLTGAHGRTAFSALYAVGLLGLGVAEGAQVLGVVTLIGQWLSRAKVQKQPREL